MQCVVCLLIINNQSPYAIKIRQILDYSFKQRASQDSPICQQVKRFSQTALLWQPSSSAAVTGLFLSPSPSFLLSHMWFATLLKLRPWGLSPACSAFSTISRRFISGSCDRIIYCLFFCPLLSLRLGNVQDCVSTCHLKGKTATRVTLTGLVFPPAPFSFSQLLLSFIFYKAWVVLADISTILVFCDINGWQIFFYITVIIYLDILKCICYFFRYICDRYL